MNKEIKELWATALESGEYKQGHKVLCSVGEDDSKRYCCLGVLCELAVKAGVIPEPVDREDAYVGRSLYFGGPRESSGAYLPKSVATWAGLEDQEYKTVVSNPMIGEFTATILNDLKGFTFPEIAAKIREHL